VFSYLNGIPSFKVGNPASDAGLFQNVMKSRYCFLQLQSTKLLLSIFMKEEYTFLSVATCPDVHC
jgi:hypothetical protein